MSARTAEDRRARGVRGALVLLVAMVLAAVVMAGAPAPAHAAPPVGPATVSGGDADWGVKASFRSYITGPIAGGSISTADGATVNPDGTFRLPNATGSYNAGVVDANFGGSVHFTGHAGALDMTISDLNVAITSATTGTLYADVVSRAFDDGELDTYDNVVFASLDLTGITPSEAGTTFTWSNIPATLTADGSTAFSGFYPAGTALDPITAVLELQTPTWTPQIVVSKTTNVDPAGETVTVTGSGFDPTANISTRPPVPVGMPTGVYVLFGRFADTWKPSQAAPSSARKVIDQKWPLPAASKAAAGAAFGPNPQYVALQPDGTFTTTLHLSPNETFTGNYGIATMAAGGAAPNASQETFTPVSFIAPTGTDAATSVGEFDVRGNKDDTKFSVAVTNVDTNEFTVAPSDIDVTVEVNGVEVTDPVMVSSPNARKLKATRVGKFNYLWTHGASLQAGDVVEVTACVTIRNDDWPANNCSTTLSPSGSVDIATTTSLSAITTRKTSVAFKSSVANNGTASVLLRPDNVEYTLYVNDVQVGDSVVSKTALGSRKIVKPAKLANYYFTWSFGSVAIGDVLEVVTCVHVPGDVGSGNNCSDAIVVVVK
jgi:hypothetical protein